MHMCMATLYWRCSESEGEREGGREEEREGVY